MTTVIHRRVEELRAGGDVGCIARMSSGWAVMNQRQVLPGTCLLLPDPVVPALNALAGAARLQFLADMATLGDAVQQATHAVRINYAILGNQDPALHAHVIPRYRDELPALATSHPWAYDWAAAPAFEVLRYAELGDRIRAALGGPA